MRGWIVRGLGQWLRRCVAPVGVSCGARRRDEIAANSPSRDVVRSSTFQHGRVTKTFATPTPHPPVHWSRLQLRAWSEDCTVYEWK